MKKSLGLNAVMNGVRTLLNVLFPLITFPYVSKVLGVENVGVYNFSASINNYFSLIAAFGISTYAVREGAKYRTNKAALDNFASEVFSINIISTFAAYVIYVLSLTFVPKLQDYRVILLVLSVEILFATIGTEWIFTIFEEYTYITIRSIVFKLISMALLFLLVKKPSDYVVYAGITVFANMAPNILNCFRAKKYCRIHFRVHSCHKKHIAAIFTIFASLAATSLYVNAGATMLGFMSSDYAVGIYSVASKVYSIIKQLLSAVLIVSIPRLAMYRGQGMYKKYRNTIAQIFNVLMMLVLPAVVGLFFLSKEVVLLISDESFIDAAGSLQLLCVALLFCIFGWFYNQCILIPAKKEKKVLIATVISAVSCVSLNMLLIPVINEKAAAVATIVAEGVMMFFSVYHGRKEVCLDKTILHNFITVIVGCIGIAFICILVKTWDIGVLWTAVFSVVGSLICYILLLLLMKNQSMMSFYARIKKMIQ